MRIGTCYVHGVVYQRATESVDLWQSVQPFIKKNHSIPSSVEIKRLDSHVNDVMQIYTGIVHARNDKMLNSHATVTQIRREIRYVSHAANKILYAENDKKILHWNGRLIDALSASPVMQKAKTNPKRVLCKSISLPARDLIYKRLNRFGYTPMQLKQSLQCLPLTQAKKEMLHILIANDECLRILLKSKYPHFTDSQINIQLSGLAPVASFYGDPELATVIVTMAKIWQSVTGMSDLSYSTNTGAARIYKFRHWLETIFKAFGLAPPSHGTIEEICRAQRRTCKK